MNRTAIGFFTVAAAALTLIGFRTPTYAQAPTCVKTIAWTAVSGKYQFAANVQVSPTVNGMSGYIGGYGMDWNMPGGSVATASAFVDSTGRHMAIKAYALVDCKLGKKVQAVAQMAMTQHVNGANTEGLKITRFSDGALIYSSGVNEDGSIAEIPVVNGYLAIF